MEPFKRYAYAYLALHALFDLTLAVIAYRQVGILVPSIWLMVMCCYFSFFLYFGLRNEEFGRWFPGKFSRRPIGMAGEPVAYWVVFAVAILFHLIITGIAVRVVYWYPN